MDRIIFERGLILARTDAGWELLHGDGTAAIRFGHPREATERYGLRPIAGIESRGDGLAVRYLFTADNGQNFGVVLAEMQQSIYRIPGWFAESRPLIYTVGAVGHHCINLAIAYSQVCSLYFSAFVQRGLVRDSEFTSFQNQEECYFEFDALLSVLRRAYDALRIPIWKCFEGRPGRPRALYKTIPECRNLPPAFRNRLEEAWRQDGERITLYRDCMTHYEPLELGLGTARMRRTIDNSTIVDLLIPDNPSAQSARRFTFANQTDSLTFGWEAATNLLRLSEAVVSAITDHLISSA